MRVGGSQSRSGNHTRQFHDRAESRKSTDLGCEFLTLCG
ncbi:Uncharacterised protein [Vibrio cholerae]|nr:Uncharacterised protein [Vibrio cholerae]